MTKRPVESRSASQNKSLLGSTSYLLSTKQAAEYLNCSERFLELARMKGAGPAYIRCARKMIRYRVEDLSNWIENCRRTSTSDDGDVA